MKPKMKPVAWVLCWHATPDSRALTLHAVGVSATGRLLGMRHTETHTKAQSHWVRYPSLEDAERAAALYILERS